MRNDVISNSTSESIERTATEMLGFSGDRTHVYGVAFAPIEIQADSFKGMSKSNNFLMYEKSFGGQSSFFLNYIKGQLNVPGKKFEEIEIWLNHAS
jgi:hypothetical protein